MNVWSVHMCVTKSINECPLLPLTVAHTRGEVLLSLQLLHTRLSAGQDETIIKIFKMRPIHFLPSVIWVQSDMTALVRLLGTRRGFLDANEIHTGIWEQCKTLLVTHNSQKLQLASHCRKLSCYSRPLFFFESSVKEPESVYMSCYTICFSTRVSRWHTSI